MNTNPTLILQQYISKYVTFFFSSDFSFFVVDNSLSGELVTFTSSPP